MKKIKIFIALIIFAICVVIIYSCTKDIVPESKNEGKENISLRSIGNYSVIDGRLYFPTINDYNSTIEFLSQATESEIIQWRSTLNVITVSKAYNEFLNAYDNGDTLSENELTNLESVFAGKIRITTDEFGIKEYLPKLPAFTEFVNLGGLLQVGNTIIKVTENKIISLVDPSKISDLNSINDNTPRNEELGIFPHEIIGVRSDMCPCNNPNSMTCENSHGTFGRRFKLSYLAEVWIWTASVGKNQFINSLAMNVDAKSKHQQKKLIGWWDQAINSTHKFRASGHITSSELGWDKKPWVVPEITNSVTNKVNNNINYFKSIGQFSTTSDDFPVKVCVTSERQYIHRDGWAPDYSCLLECY